MGIYSTFSYGDGTKYGQAGAVQFDVSPFTATSTGFASALVKWTIPDGDFLALRLVRNQEGQPEHYEDGVVLFTDLVTNLRSSFTDIDGSQPLVSGEQASYSIWVLLTDYTWLLIGTAECVIPRPHGESAPDGTELVSSPSKFASIIPRTYLSSGKTYLDEIDESSDLYQFLAGMSLSLDEAYTVIENLSSKSVGTNSNSAISVVEAQSLGIPELVNAGDITLKRITRQAISNYSTKGTATAISSFCAAATRYGVEVSVSPNLMLNMQDSTFYKATVSDSYTGRWVSGATADITAEEGTVTQDVSEWTLDRTWYGVVDVTEASSTGFVALAASSATSTDDRILNGIPIEAGVSYKFSFKASCEAGTGGVTLKAVWHDRTGNIIGDEVTVVAADLTSAGTWYSIDSEEFAAPEATYDEEGVLLTEQAMFLGLVVYFDSVDEYHIDMFSVYKDGDFRGEDYYEPRAVEVYLYPSKTNYIFNPSFELLNVDEDIAGWDFNGLTTTREEVVIPGIFHGDFVAQLVPSTGYTGDILTTTTSHILPVGEYFTFSIYGRSLSGTTGDLTISVSMEDSEGTTVGPLESDTFQLTTSWARHSFRIYVPDTLLSSEEGVASTKLTISVTGDPNDLTLQFDAAQLEVGHQPTDYFDGSMSTYGALYSGDDPDTADDDEDISFLYYNFGTKSRLLEATIESQVPVFSPYYVTFGDYNLRSLAFSGISE